MTTRRYNFSAGPAVLPDAVLHAAQQALWDLDGSGVGILEHSHRGPEFLRVLDGAEAAVREVAAIPDDYAVLFLAGGATLQFPMVPANFLRGGRADYVLTGTWSGKAIEEAQRLGQVHVAGSSEASKFDRMPDALRFSAAPAYVHITSNETIHGTQWASEPTTPAGVPVVCDASSDLFSRPLDVKKYAMIYASAQKNIGPPGVTLVIARKDFIDSGDSAISPLFQYRTYARERSLYNTPNTLGVYVIGEVMKWIQARGGLAAMGEHNRAKAAALYDFLDGSKAWKPHAQVGSRSQMNVTFRGASVALEEQVLAEAERRGMNGLRGHRSVGGIRASIYNAFPAAGVTALIQLLADVERSG